MIVVLLSLIVLLSFGIIEQYFHNRRLRRIPVRIHITGTRGKSTTTRLIASILKEAGYKVVAKTTGSLPMLIFEDGTEIEIKRRSWPRIHEQIKAISVAASPAAHFSKDLPSKSDRIRPSH